MKQQIAIESVTRAEAVHVTDVLWEAFFDYPVMRFVLGNGPDYNRRVARMIGLFVAARALRDDIMLGIRFGGDLVAVATTSDPSNPPHPDFAALRDQVWHELGAEAKARYDLCVNTWDSLAVNTPQLHVNMIGVRRAHQRGGLARALLERVHDMAALSRTWQGVTLTTEDPRNVPFYERQGYRVIGKRDIAPGLQTWSFWRECE